MKRNYVIIIGFLLFSMNMNSQNIGINTDTPDNSALLELSSNDRGFLLPRMTTVERDNIDLTGNPLSCLIFNTDSLCFQTYVGNEWRNLWCYEGDTSSKCSAGPAVGFTNCGDNFTYAGQVYSTVLIGSQCWMAENLNYGTRINTASTQTDNGIVEKYCYNDNIDSCTTYGGLYQWDEMMCYSAGSSSNPSGVQGICPDGWHIPSDDEWKELEGEVDNTYNYGDPEWDGTGFRGDDAAGNLKETGTSHWLSPNTGATNSYGFTALPGGYRHTSGSFQQIQEWATFRDATNGGNHHQLLYNNETSLRYTMGASLHGMSVRCVKD